jgi:hypothetical protein
MVSASPERPFAMLAGVSDGKEALASRAALAAMSLYFE